MAYDICAMGRPQTTPLTVPFALHYTVLADNDTSGINAHHIDPPLEDDFVQGSPGNRKYFCSNMLSLMYIIIYLQ